MAIKVVECGKTLTEVEERVPTRWLIYGKTGVGKTFSLQTLPESMRPALILDFDRGARKIKDTLGLGTIVTFDIEAAPDKPLLYDQAKEFLQNFYLGKVELPTPCADYKTVVVDSFTMLTKAIQDRTLVWYTLHGEKGNTRDTLDLPPTMPEYGMISHLSLKFVQALIQLNRNLIVFCHDAETIKDEVTGVATAGPALQRALATSMPRYFDEVLYAKMNGIKHVWATQTTGLFVARTRHDLPAEISQDFAVYK